MDSNNKSRRRSSSTLANAISFTHTRHEPQQPETQPEKSQQQSAFNYSNKNSSQTTLHSITQTLSNVGFNKLSSITAPPQTGTTESTSSSSSTTGNKLNKLLKLSKLKEKAGNSNNNSNSNTAVTAANAIATSSASIISSATSIAETATPNIFHSNNHSHHSHHHHSIGLSSSASNSKVIDSSNTLYSFDTSNPINYIDINHSNLMKNLINYENNYRLITFNDRDSIADSILSAFSSKLMPLFRSSSSSSAAFSNGMNNNSNELKLKTPIEDFCKMLQVYLNFRIENKYNGIQIITELQEILKNGFKIMENDLSYGIRINEDNEEMMKNSNNIEILKLVIIWQYFIQKVYFYLLSIFVPLDYEFNTIGRKLRRKKYWKDVKLQLGLLSNDDEVDDDAYDTYNDNKDNKDDVLDYNKLTVKNFILISFRDFIILPYFNDEINFSNSSIETEDKKVLIQMFGIISGIQSNNYNQRQIEHLLLLVEESVYK